MSWTSDKSMNGGKKKKHGTQGVEDSLQRKTIDGQTVTITGRGLISHLQGRAVCVGGVAHGCYMKDPHRFTVKGDYFIWVGVPAQRLTQHIDKETVKQAYRCRKCHAFMGCHVCAGEVSDLVCLICKDWANDIAEQVHGRIVSPELATIGFKLVDMVYRGQIDTEGFNRLWGEARDEAKK